MRKKYNYWSKMDWSREVVETEEWKYKQLNKINKIMERIWNEKVDNTTEKIIDNILDYLFDNGYMRKDIATTDNVMLDNMYSIVGKELKKL